MQPVYTMMRSVAGKDYKRLKQACLGGRTQIQNLGKGRVDERLASNERWVAAAAKRQIGGRRIAFHDPKIRSCRRIQPS